MHGQAKFAATWRSLLITAVLVGIATSSSAAETGHLTELRSEALELVNEARKQHGLPALQSRPELDRAAQAHAEDMLNRNYFDHVSPEGKTVFDRYVAAGGSRWRLVAENIGRCATCKGPPRISDVTRLQDGWMRSASHRENILSPGVTQFGFGMVAAADRGLYAVQSFAGPGTSPSPAARHEARRLSKSEQLTFALDLINHARRRKGAAELRPSKELTDALQSLIASIDMESELHPAASLSSEMASVQRRRSKSIAIIAAGCGGCGAEAAASDVRFLVQQWLDIPEYRETLLAPRFSHFGFAERVDGEGRKVALAALGVSP
jgi:uncharacterized protein YkwD